LLKVRNLRVTYRSDAGFVEAVRGVSFDVGHERVAIVGESGSGKSTIGRAIMRLEPATARVQADLLEFEGQDLLRLPERALSRLRGRRVGLILQDPRYSLNPSIPVGEQVLEMLELHSEIPRRAAHGRVLEMLGAVGISDPERVYGLYPHAVSGGMGQRIMIAMMMAPEPDLLIADEATSALDVTVQHQVLGMIDDMLLARPMGLIFISHDLPTVCNFCDRVLIMRGGDIVDQGPADAIKLSDHPYTRQLFAAVSNA
jgi:peptide/nickel transport system ATP-binding protein